MTKVILLYNAIQCPDGTIIESKHRHDFVQHKQLDGRDYFVDGGLDYQRIGYSDNEFINLLVTTEDDHAKIREVFEWTSNYDANMNPIAPVKRKLKDLTDDHVKALVIWTEEGYPEYVHKIMLDEAEYRNLEV